MFKGTFSLLAAGLLLVACDSTSAPRPPVSYAPEVQLSSDPPGSDTTRLDLRATVTSRDAVERVAFYRDGKLLAEDREAPYTWTDRIEDGVTYTYQAYAYDVAGRRGVSDYYDVRQSPALESVSGQLYDSTSLTAPAEVKPWSGGAGTAELLAGGQSVQKAPLAADGTFALNLKQAPQSGWLPATPQSLVAQAGFPGCQGTASSSDSAARLVLGQVKVSAGRSGDAAPLKVLPPTQAGSAQLNYFSLGSLVYADRTVSLTGRLTCPAGQSSTAVDFQLPLRRGWNKVTQQVTQRSGAALPSQISFATGFPQPEQWALLPQRP